LLIRSNGNVQTYYYELTKSKKSITVYGAKISGIKGYQVKTYKGKNIYSKWSSVKNIKTK
jgi:hypothetical protein